MKRLWTFLLAVVIVLNLAGCHGSEPPTPTATTVALPTPTPTPQPLPTPTPPTTPPPEETTSAPPPETQPPVLAEPEDADFVRVVDYIPTAQQDLPYATVNNFTGQRIYDFTDAYLRYGTVKKLMQVCAELETQGLGLVIWDGFRPVAAQAALWEICPDPNFVSHPVTGRRTHCRGNTVDVTLYNLQTGKELPMPTGFDNFTAYADRDYSDCSPEAAENARALEQVMAKYGFSPYFGEWWHFADTQDYPIDEHFYPGTPALWRANCEEYISLRQSPEGTVLAKIPKDGLMQLEGWQGKYARVKYDGQTGYVLANYILPQRENYLEDALTTVTVTHMYSYEQLLSDLTALQAQYPGLAAVDSIGVSALGREIPVLRIGNENAKYHVLLQGAIHGKEHLGAWLLMAMADCWLQRDLLSYGDICYHIIPMANPDGVILSQTGHLTEQQMDIYRSDKENGYTTAPEDVYAANWKANGLGTDINRNFPAGWEAIDERTAPSSQQYRGTAPFSAPEAAALRDYTLRYDFDATVSYHATGSILYWAYGDKQPVNSQSKALAQAVEVVSGYDLAGNQGVDGAGYKDWAMDRLEIPSITIEIGCADAPLAQREVASIFLRNYRVLPAIARWLQHESP